LNKSNDISRKPRLYVYHTSQCDPKKCTATKLLRLGLAKPIARLSCIPRKAIVLDPFSNMIITYEDRADVLLHGLVAIDCSWENAEQLFTVKLRAQRRRLPEMLAGNSINYNVRNKLSTVEAFAGALIICGFSEQAREILAKFKWGQNFLELNQTGLLTNPQS
jgi:pre-rRNA-processing protein TSR3